MMKTAVFALTIASTCLVGCSQPAPSQSAAAGQAESAASPSNGAPAAAQPGTPAGQATPAASPQAPASAPRSNAQAGGTAFETGAFSPAPPVSQAPAMQEVTIPAGTELHVTLLNSLASDTSRVEDAVKGSLAKPVLVSGTTALPEGTQLSGSVMDAQASGRVKGRASLAFRFNRLVVRGETVDVRTATVTREAAADTKSDVKKGGIGAGIGAVVGGVVGGGKGAAIGAVAGGAGTVLATKGDEVKLPSGTAVTVRLQDPLTITVPKQ
jgi:outer membrane lipoprotein SlyB